jgi:DNA-binding winged helix-turn-helix (wHTH) protein
LKKKTREFPFLIAQEGYLNGQRWPITKEMVIGRDEDCDICIPDRQVSRFHLKLLPQLDQTIAISDLKSKNGTFVNGKRITGYTIIKDGDQIKVALTQNFFFISSESTVPLEKIKKTGGRLLIDSKARRIWLLEKEVIPAFSVQQYKLLNCLYENSGEVISRERIIHAVWGNKEGLGVTEQALDALIRRLRDRLAEFDEDHNYLVTVRGYGFRLDNPIYKSKKSR